MAGFFFEFERINHKLLCIPEKHPKTVDYSLEIEFHRKFVPKAARSVAQRTGSPVFFPSICCCVPNAHWICQKEYFLISNKYKIPSHPRDTLMSLYNFLLSIADEQRIDVQKFIFMVRCIRVACFAFRAHRWSPRGDIHLFCISNLRVSCRCSAHFSHKTGRIAWARELVVAVSVLHFMIVAMECIRMQMNLLDGTIAIRQLDWSIDGAPQKTTNIGFWKFPRVIEKKNHDKPTTVRVSFFLRCETVSREERRHF